MAQHLELSYTSEHSSDRRVLQLYPSSLTRRVLRWVWGGGRGGGGAHPGLSPAVALTLNSLRS